jgi:site-specific DNA-methyltransferase (adenine-specific)
LSGDVTAILEDLGFLLRGEIIWQKAHAASGSCAWGSYQRPGNPVLRDLTERVVVASKGRFDRAVPAKRRLRDGWPNEGSMFMDDFVDATVDVWDIPAESATRVGHPAPFPVELPRRLIDLYTYRGDLVLDPFMGSGSTAVAAVRTERHYVGFDTDPDYVTRAIRRIDDERGRLGHGGVGAGRGPRVVVPALRAVAVDGDEEADFQVRAVRQGQKARELAVQALEACGFGDIERNVPYPDLGVDVSFRARDRRGGLWLFDLSGAFSSTRPGLKRTDTLWKALGKAAVLREAARTAPARRDLGPLILLSTDVPVAHSAGERALRVATSAEGGGLVHDVVELLDAAGLERLRACAEDGPPSR